MDKRTFSVNDGLTIFLALALLIASTGCMTGPRIGETPQPMVEWMPDPTAADTLEQLVADLSSEDPVVRKVSALALEKFGRKAKIAVPALITNLEYEEYSIVRRSAAVALGRLGSDAKQAVPMLVSVAQNEKETDQVRRAAVVALGKIGDKSTVPALVDILYEEDLPLHILQIISAESIAEITGEKFRDSGEDSYGYATNDDGIPFIVIDAQKWWEEQGRYQEW